MNDKELLGLAAKAAGVSGGWGDKIEYHNGTVDLRDVWILEGDDFVPWNPLNDDGDALRLAVNLELQLRLRRSENEVSVYGAPDGRIDEGVRGDPAAATRRAIVRAAAEIGKSL